MSIQEFFSNIIETMTPALITAGADLRVKQFNTNALRTSAIINGIQNIKRHLDRERAANAETANKADINLGNLKIYLADRDIDPFLDTIEEGAFRASSIASNMLKFSKPQIYSREPCDINLVLEQSINFVLKDYKPHDESGLIDNTIGTRLLDDLRGIKVLSVELQQVFVNFIKNTEHAIKARKESEDQSYCGTISLDSRTGDEEVAITITDNGSGMTGEVAQKAFDPYFTTRSSSGGTGLGLSTVYRVIKTLLCGETEIRSAPEPGTQFIITPHACGKPTELSI